MSPKPAVAPAVDVREDAAEPLIRVANLDKTYGQGTAKTWVLRRVGLEVKDGEFVSIMGPSGAGKSTLLHVLGMHEGGWEGEYWLLGHPVHKLDPKARAELRNRTVGFVFQQYHLIDDLTVYENIEMPLSYRNVPKAERAGIVADVLDRFQIVGKKDLFPRQLSGGQQQLVAIARAIVAQPRLILADEPTGNLHSDQGREIMELFRALNATGVTVIQVTHSESNAAYGSRIVRLRDGWVEGEGPSPATS
jgi:putative ABC transport system ATP-binding protein